MGNNNRILHIWCDESDKKGKYYSNFYGGVLVRGKDLNEVKNRLENVCAEQNLHKEIKWQKVTANYLHKYITVISEFFSLIFEDKIKLRIMFTSNAQIPKELSDAHKSNEYFILYYQFFKHAFGLKYSAESKGETYIRANFDQLPDTIRRRDIFKDYIQRLQNQEEYRISRIRIEKDHIAEVDSKDHMLLQFMDIVLGSISFRLNDKHKEKPEGKRIRGKKTIAKEKLYKHINAEIRKTRPNFNIGVSTGIDGDYRNRWNHPYRHWLFIGKNSELDESLTKRKSSDIPTSGY